MYLWCHRCSKIHHYRECKKSRCSHAANTIHYPVMNQANISFVVRAPTQIPYIALQPNLTPTQHTVLQIMDNNCYHSLQHPGKTSTFHRPRHDLQQQRLNNTWQTTATHTNPLWALQENSYITATRHLIFWTYLPYKTSPQSQPKHYSTLTTTPSH